VIDVTLPPYNCSPTAANNAPGLQAAIHAAQTSGACLYIPAGAYKVDSMLTVNGRLSIKGDGRSATQLALTAPVPLFSITTESGVNFAGFTISTSLSSASAIGILVDPGSGKQNTGSLFDDMEFYGLGVGMDFRRAQLWTVSRSLFTDCLVNSISVRNIDHVDNGDSVVTESVLKGPSSTIPAVHIAQYSSGGLRIMNNKFFKGGVQYKLELAAGAYTSNLFISGNSMEGSGGGGIVLSAISPASAQFRYVLIENNVIDGPGSWNGIVAKGPGDWLWNVTICNNQIGSNEFPPQDGVGSGIDLGAGRNVSIAGNVLENWLPNSGTKGIAVSSAVLGCVMAANSTLHYGLANAVINNASAGSP
jgi:hypothetical protein